MSYWVVERASKFHGDSGTLIGIAKTGDPIYVYHQPDAIRFADERSAMAFERLCVKYGPDPMNNMDEHYNTVHVVNG